MKALAVDWTQVAHKGLFIVGFLMLALFGVVFEGGSSPAYLLSLGILLMFTSLMCVIVPQRCRIEQLEKLTVTLARHLYRDSAKEGGSDMADGPRGG